MSNKMRKKIVSILVVLFLLIIFGGTKLLRIASGGGERNIYKRYFESHPELSLLSQKSKELPFRVGIVGTHESVAESYGLETFGGRSPLFNKYFHEYFVQVVLPQLKTAKKYEKFVSYWYELGLNASHLPFHPEHKFDQIPNAKDLNLDLLLAANVKYLISSRSIVGMDKHASSITIDDGQWYGNNIPVGGILWEGVDRLVSSFNIMSEGPIGRRREPLRLHIYELRKSFSRAYLTPNIALFSSEKEVFSAVKKATLKDFKRSAFLTHNSIEEIQIKPALNNGLDENRNQVKLVSYEPDKILLHANIDSPNFLVVTNNFNPNWKVTVNGKEKKILRTNYVFQGVYLPQAGKYQVELHYSNPTVIYAYLLVLCGVLLIFKACTAPKREDKHNIIA